MKQFHFRLERVLRLKRQRERHAEIQQAHVRSQVDAARLQRTMTQERLKRETAACANRPAHTITASMRIAAFRYLAQIQQQLEADEAQVRKTEQNLAEANDQRVKIHREVESLDFLRRAKWEEHQRDSAQIMQQQLDELSLRRWQMQDRNNEIEANYEMEVTGS